ncbi:MAG: MGMT family protein, partial [Chloroflexota bacterium]
ADLFNLTVYRITRQIPRGIVSTYGQIASMIPPPDGVNPDDYIRLSSVWVGQALNQTPDGQGIPWQRVINSQGGISLPGAAARQQRTLLEAEGVVFDTRDRVDFERYGWDGPGEAWLTANGLNSPRSLRRGGPTQLSLF